jgi:hypothetical protein
MSSTNRGGDRHAADYYVTPQKPIHDFLTALSEDDPSQFGWSDGGGFYQRMASGISILDPCAGGDDKTEMAYPKALRDGAARGLPGWPVISSLTTVDWRQDSRAEYKGVDFLMWNSPHTFDMAITNPPFAIAQEIIERCFQVVRPGGLVVMLLRLNFFGGEGRNEWWQKNMPTVCYVHSKRIGFMGHMELDSPDFIEWRAKQGAKFPTDEKALQKYRTQTDSIEYMHAVWVVGEQPRFTAVRML